MNPMEPSNVPVVHDEQEGIVEPSSHEVQNEENPSSSSEELKQEVPEAMEVKEAEESGFIASISRCVQKIVPPGGVLGSAFNLASSSIGAGILGLPSATNSSGLVMALLYLTVITMTTIFSLNCICIAAQRTQVRSFEGASRVLLGRWFEYFVAGVRAFHSLSGCVAYVISVGDIFSAIMDHSDDAPDFLKRTSGNRLLTSAVWLCIMLPLVIPKHIDSLRYFSTFAVTFMLYFVVVIIVHSCMNGLPDNVKDISVGKDDDASVVLFNSGNKAIEGLGVFMFAYVCQNNAYEVYWDMENPTQTRFTLAGAIGMGLCFVLYSMTAAFGYLDMGNGFDKSILLAYDPISEPAIMVAFVGVLSKLCASYALLSMSLRNPLYHSIGWDVDELPYWKHCAAVITLACCTLIMGLFIPNINTVLGFAGSITGGSLGFLLPALLVMYSGDFSWEKAGPLRYILTYVLLIVGVIGVVFGTCATIHATAVG
ncbi:amino acid transporter [Trypanosoma grayi]|uniref:amino acid transporter n=1 Tax=Trypanosoma grayi TaxID=71804 RepID=UPI0004F499A0|nr:amino acid transporter [Trypanosoma grayi]KEG06370.1 amino acid transporter [Trypanosoma grayi]